MQKMADDASFQQYGNVDEEDTLDDIENVMGEDFGFGLVVLYL